MKPASHKLGEKAMACLRMAEALHSKTADAGAEWVRLYAEASTKWSEKAVLAKFEELISRGYMDCGVSARTGWLTPKGRAALASGLGQP